MKKTRTESVFAAALALAATATLGGCAGTASSGTTQADAARNVASGSHACATGQIAVSATDPEAGVGHRSLTILLTNTGSAACVLQGYPGAAVTDIAGALILDAQRTLRGYMGWAAGVVKVNPPNSTRTTSVALPTDICQELLIHPVVSGTSGRS
jgi:hypothetical protein